MDRPTDIVLHSPIPATVCRAPCIACVSPAPLSLHATRPMVFSEEPAQAMRDRPRHAAISSKAAATWRSPMGPSELLPSTARPESLASTARPARRLGLAGGAGGAGGGGYAGAGEGGGRFGGAIGEGGSKPPPSPCAGPRWLDTRKAAAEPTTTTAVSMASPPKPEPSDWVLLPPLLPLAALTSAALATLEGVPAFKCTNGEGCCSGACGASAFDTAPLAATTLGLLLLLGSTRGRSTCASAAGGAGLEPPQPIERFRRLRPSVNLWLCAPGRFGFETAPRRAS